MRRRDFMKLCMALAAGLYGYSFSIPIQKDVVLSEAASILSSENTDLIKNVTLVILSLCFVALLIVGCFALVGVIRSFRGHVDE